MTESEHLSRLTLDALAADALGAPARAEAERHLGDCAVCRADIEETRAVRARFARDVFPRTENEVLARASSALGRERARRVWVFAALPAIAAAAAIVLAIAPGGGSPHVEHPSSDDYVGVKGDASLRVIAKRRNGEIVELVDGARLHPGDGLRFIVEPAGQRFLIVASIDGEGKASLFYPTSGTSSAQLPPGGRVELPGSIVLDDARGRERIYALFSKAPMPTASVLDALSSLGKGGPSAILETRSLAVPADVQRSLLIEKVTP